MPGGAPVPSKEEAENYLRPWYFWATHSRIQPIIKAAKTIKSHWDGVLRWFESHINNGILEGINNLAQAAKAKAKRLPLQPHFRCDHLLDLRQTPHSITHVKQRGANNSIFLS